MGAGHFIYIPTIIMIGIVIGWILGSRAARDAFAAELRRREEAEDTETWLLGEHTESNPNRDENSLFVCGLYRPSANLDARTSGKPGL